MADDGERGSRARPRDPAERTELHLGVADEDSYLRRELWPTGVARGWRRTGCISGIALVLVLLVVALALRVVAA